MKEKTSVISKLSLCFGIAAYPLSIIAFFIFFLGCLCRVPEIKPNYFTASIVFYCIVAILAITSIVLGIIGIKQHTPKKGIAVAGIIISSLKILLSVIFIVFPFLGISIII